MSRSSLKEAMNVLNVVGLFHYPYSDNEIMAIAPDLQPYGSTVLNEVITQAKSMERRPTGAKLISMCKDELRNQAVHTPQMPEESPDTWMTSTEYAKTQGFDSLSALITHKIVAKTKADGSSSTNETISSTIENEDFWSDL